MPIATRAAPSNMWATSFMQGAKCEACASGRPAERPVPRAGEQSGRDWLFALLLNGNRVTLEASRSYLYTRSVSSTSSGVRTTIYLAGPAAKVLERVKTEYRDRYGIATTVSSVLARLLLGETIEEVVERPYRSDLARLASERERLRDELRRAQARRRTAEVHRIHDEVASLYPAVKKISNTLGRARRRNEPYSPDFDDAARIEKSLDELMAECGDAIAGGRRR